MKPTVIYSDEQIRKLMDERKVLPDNWEIQLKKSQRGVSDRRQRQPILFWS